MENFTWIIPLPSDPWTVFINFCKDLFFMSYSVFVSMTTFFRTPVRLLIPGVYDDLFLNTLENTLEKILKVLGLDIELGIRDFSILQLMFGLLLVVVVLGFVWSFAIRIVKIFIGLG